MFQVQTLRSCELRRMQPQEANECELAASATAKHGGQRHQNENQFEDTEWLNRPPIPGSTSRTAEYTLYRISI